MIRRPPSSPLFPYSTLYRSSRVGVVPEVLTDGVNAALVPAGDAAALADAIARLLGEPAARERLGHAGRALVESRYSGARLRSEEHTSELQSQSNLVCRLLLE